MYFSPASGVRAPLGLQRPYLTALSRTAKEKSNLQRGYWPSTARSTNVQMRLCLLVVGHFGLAFVASNDNDGLEK
jgi:hypothetical protein